MSNEVLFKSAKLAVLIDADNAMPDLIEPLLKEVAKYGTASVKRIYGDWTNNQLNSWKSKLIDSALQPIQQFTYTNGKNSTDSALIIDAMDLLYTSRFDGFCIVSSDSDFTRLAQRIRESGLLVYGFGERKTPSSFVRMCDKFVFTEILKQSSSATANNSKNVESGQKSASSADFSLSSKSTAEETKGANSQKSKSFNGLTILLKDAYEATVEEDGWANLGLLGHNLQKLSSSFDSRNYGHKQLSSLVRATEMFEVKPTPKGTRIKLKPGKQKS